MLTTGLDHVDPRPVGQLAMQADDDGATLDRHGQIRRRGAGGVELDHELVAGAVDVVRQWVRAVLGAVRRELVDLLLAQRAKGVERISDYGHGLTSLSMSTLSIYQ